MLVCKGVGHRVERKSLPSRSLGCCHTALVFGRAVPIKGAPVEKGKWVRPDNGSCGLFYIGDGVCASDFRSGLSVSAS